MKEDLSKLCIHLPFEPKESANESLPAPTDFKGWIGFIGDILMKRTATPFEKWAALFNAYRKKQGLPTWHFPSPALCPTGGLDEKQAALYVRLAKIQWLERRAERDKGRWKNLHSQELEQWKIDVWNHFEFSMAIIQTLPKTEQAKAKAKLKAFGGHIATKELPKQYSSLIGVAQELVSDFLELNKWPTRSELEKHLNSNGFQIKESTFFDCLDELNVTHLVRDNQQG